MKALLKRASDPYLAMLEYRTSPLSNGYGPAELLMNRRLRTTVPLTQKSRQPVLPTMTEATRKENDQKAKQKENFDTRHATRPLPTLQSGDQVWIPDREIAGRVLWETQPRSYVIKTPQGLFKRNRKHLIWEQGDAVDEEDDDNPETSEEDLAPSRCQDSSCTDSSPSLSREGTTTRSGEGTTTRSGRLVRPPERLDL